MSTANGRPLSPPAPSRRAQPDEGDRRSTGVRPRTPSHPDAGEPLAPLGVTAPNPTISDNPGPLAEGIRNNSIPPESLRKPFASLAPQPKKSTTQTSPNRTATGPRPQLESISGVEDELTSPGNTSTGSTSAGRTKSSRAVCKKHKIARGKNGECMLCRKEEAARASGLGWKLMVAFIVLAVVVSAAIAGVTFLQKV